MFTVFPSLVTLGVVLSEDSSADPPQLLSCFSIRCEDVAVFCKQYLIKILKTWELHVNNNDVLEFAVI